ncbi:hypothetical protein [Streptomyces macrosporus]|uniref:hypothetical protein n=1 Tax=Streptomyces macrosporus TaxID=44032 RepID=UPI0031D4408F
MVLYLSDLETLSWLAGAGSFATAVPSLTIAVLLARTPPPRDPTPGQRTGFSDFAGPAVFELTTFAIRLRDRAFAALQGAAKGVAMLWCLVGLMILVGKSEQFTAGEGLKSTLLLALLIMVGLSVAEAIEAADGRDVLVVDTGGLTVVDKRHCRLDRDNLLPRNQSFSIRWDELESIRLVADPEGGAHSLIVTFEDFDHGVKRASKHNFPERGGSGSYVVGRLLLGTAVEERTALLTPLRTALTRYGRGKLQG